MSEDNGWVFELLRLASKYDACESLQWTEDLRFFINCNDVFFWACADAEKVTKADVPLLAQCWLLAGAIDGDMLYCARKRKLRPQGAMYKFIDEENWHLFDAVGPERDPKTPGNTPKPEPKQ